MNLGQKDLVTFSSITWVLETVEFHVDKVGPSYAFYWIKQVMSLCLTQEGIEEWVGQERLNKNTVFESCRIKNSTAVIFEITLILEIIVRSGVRAGNF